MRYVRLYIGAIRHLKIATLSDATFRVWMKGLAYCQANETDGVIPHDALEELGAKPKDVQTLVTPRVVGKAPLWEPHPLGYLVHDYLDWNDARVDIAAQRVKARARREAFEARRAGRPGFGAFRDRR